MIKRQYAWDNTLSMALSCWIRSILVNGLKDDSVSCCWEGVSIVEMFFGDYNRLAQRRGWLPA